MTTTRIGASPAASLSAATPAKTVEAQVAGAAPVPEGLAAGIAQFNAGNFKEAVHLLEAETTRSPTSDGFLWLGRALGRRAEKAGWMKAIGLAKESLAAFEKAYALDSTNRPALEDLISFHTEAPGIVGGNKQRAAQLRQELAKLPPQE